MVEGRYTTDKGMLLAEKCKQRCQTYCGEWVFRPHGPKDQDQSNYLKGRCQLGLRDKEGHCTKPKLSPLYLSK
ncbi:hypothetical protein HN832_02885 [archaeon]|jgi:hypothetical protein|nr:hypothetical protein [archaeon]MBT4373301.1 hypothetical protein [archaeon]MBT4531646.1 hypothetical protein [archaeon]MBT7001176.1 hypothetical protein [archaeon]MBT7282338.1 hypothetical protein [archaeon]